MKKILEYILVVELEFLVIYNSFIYYIMYFLLFSLLYINFFYLVFLIMYYDDVFVYIYLY